MICARASATRTKRNRTTQALFVSLETGRFCVPVRCSKMLPMKKGPPWINIQRAGVILLATIITASCSEKSAPAGEKDVNASEKSREAEREPEMKTAQDGDESQPEKDQIEEDCA